MKGYKGFEKGLVCRGKQYSENVIFEEKEAEICSAGMHFCQDPFEVLEHYGFLNDKAEFNDFAEVEALSEVKTNDNDNTKKDNITDNNTSHVEKIVYKDKTFYKYGFYILLVICLIETLMLIIPKINKK